MRTLLRQCRDRLHYAISALVRHTMLLPRAAVLPLNTSPTMVIAPHQDDETLGCGGLIASKIERGSDVTVVFLTDGQKGQRGDMTPEAIIPLREREAREALGALGVSPGKIHFLGIPDGTLGLLEPQQRQTLERQLADLLRATRVRDIYIPFDHDGHPDHDAVRGIASAAMAQAGCAVALNQYLVWRQWRCTTGVLSLMRGKLYVFRHNKSHKKKQAMACYRSQLPMLNRGFIDLLCKRYEFFVVS